MFLYHQHHHQLPRINKYATVLTIVPSMQATMIIQVTSTTVHRITPLIFLSRTLTLLPAAAVKQPL